MNRVLTNENGKLALTGTGDNLLESIGKHDESALVYEGVIGVDN